MKALRHSTAAPVLLLALLLGSCAASPPGPVGPSAPVETTAAPPAERADAGQSRVPATCVNLVGDTVDRLDLAESVRASRSVAMIAARQAGLLLCELAAPDAGFRLTLTVLPEPSSSWVESIASSGGGGCSGRPADTHQCELHLAVGQYGASLYLSHGTVPGVVVAEFELAAEELAAALEGLPAPLALWEPLASTLALPGACEDIDLSGTAVTTDLPGLAATPWGGGGDAPALYTMSQKRVGFVACGWELEHERVEVDILPGGSWALGAADALPAGRSIEVDGADRARWSESTYNDGQVLMVAAIGADLVQVGLDPGPFGGAPADDTVAVAVLVLESLIASLS